MLQAILDYLSAATVYYWTARQAGLDNFDTLGLKEYLEAWTITKENQ